MPLSFFMDRRIWGLDRVADGLEQARNEGRKSENNNSSMP
jgi:hypothetical protein